MRPGDIVERHLPAGQFREAWAELKDERERIGRDLVRAQADAHRLERVWCDFNAAMYRLADTATRVLDTDITGGDPQQGRALPPTWAAGQSAGPPSPETEARR